MSHHFSKCFFGRSEETYARVRAKFIAAILRCDALFSAEICAARDVGASTEIFSPRATRDYVRAVLP